MRDKLNLEEILNQSVQSLFFSGFCRNDISYSFHGNDPLSLINAEIVLFISSSIFEEKSQASSVCHLKLPLISCHKLNIAYQSNHSWKIRLLFQSIFIDSYNLRKE